MKLLFGLVLISFIGLVCLSLLSCGKEDPKSQLPKSEEQIISPPSSQMRIIDTDNDGFPDKEEASFWGTNPEKAEKWDDLDTITSILNTPAKVCKFLDRKFIAIRKPSQPFATSITQLFEEMSGDCDEFAILALYLLAENDYEAQMLQVSYDKWWQEYNIWRRHDICVYQDNDEWFYIDIYFLGSERNPVGPFQSRNEICDQLPSHYGATDWINYHVYDVTGIIVDKVTK